jgi:hypothetical protein
MTDLASARSTAPAIPPAEAPADAAPSPLRRLADRWTRFWFEPTPPDNLGLCRILFYGLLFIYFVPVDYTGWGTLPRSFFAPVWPFEKFRIPVLGDPYLALTAAVWKAALLLSCVGFFTRVSTIVAFVLGTYLIGVPYNFGKTDHMTAIIVFALGILAVSYCGDAWSVDAAIRRRFRGEQHCAPSGEYRWPVRAVWLTMALVFFAAGMAKVLASKHHWVFSEHMEISLVQRFYDPNPPDIRLGLWIALHPWAAKSMAAVSLLGELLFPLALLSRRARRILPPALLAMQLGIGLVMNVWFWPFMFCYLFWVPWDRSLPRSLQSNDVVRSA